jgi:hypothetical protein
MASYDAGILEYIGLSMPQLTEVRNLVIAQTGVQSIGLFERQFPGQQGGNVVTIIVLQIHTNAPSTLTYVIKGDGTSFRIA